MAKADSTSNSELTGHGPVATKTRYCSFCGKSEHEVHKLIAGPNNVYICDSCVELCEKIIRNKATISPSAKNLSGPSSVKVYATSEIVPGSCSGCALESRPDCSDVMAWCRYHHAILTLDPKTANKWEA